METKTCKVCGRELSLEGNFVKSKYGWSNTCNECRGKSIKAAHAKRTKVQELEEQIALVRKLRLEEFTPREMMQRLYVLGYDGELTHTTIQKVKLSEM